MSELTKDLEIIEEAKKRSSDLSTGDDVLVSTGQEKSPMPRPVDSNDARKALYKKRSGLVEEEISKGGGDDELSRAYDEINNPVKTVEPDEVSDQSQPGSVVQTDLPPTQEVVTVSINGESRTVPSRDVEAAGGITAYQQNVSSSESLRRAKQERERNEKVLSEISERIERLEQLDRRVSEEGLQAQHQATAPAQIADPSEDEIDKIYDDLYSGVDERAKSAIKALRHPARIVQSTPAPTQQPKPKQKPTEPTVDRPQSRSVGTLQSDEQAEVNSLMASYPEIMSDSGLKQRALSIFSASLSDPINKHRRAVDIARDAAEYLKLSSNTLAVRDKLAQRRANKAKDVSTSPGLTERPGDREEQDDDGRSPNEKYLDLLKKTRGQ